jgi:hypothetical protein
MKPWLLPSGLQVGIGLIIHKDWTTEQAVAVVELLDDLREVIYRHYQPQIQEFTRQDRCTELNSYVENRQGYEPF